MASIQQGPNGPVLVLKESALKQKGSQNTSTIYFPMITDSLLHTTGGITVW